MFRKTLTLLITGAVFASLSLFVIAQEQTTGITTLEDLTASADQYYDQTVTLQGAVIEFVSVNSFVLGEDVLIDDDRILVINNSGTYLSHDLFRGDRVVVTGIVHPSLLVQNDRIESDDVEITPVPTEDVEDAGDEMLTSFENSLPLYYSGAFPEDYNNFTVLEIISIEQIQTVIEVEAEE
jgi:hypothetical protein